MYGIDSRLINADGSIDHEVAHPQASTVARRRHMAMVDVKPGGRSWRHDVAGILKRLFAAHIERRTRRRQIAELSSLGPRALKDIGIDPSEITSVVHFAGRDTSRIRR